MTDKHSLPKKLNYLNLHQQLLLMSKLYLCHRLEEFDHKSFLLTFYLP